MSQEQIKRLIGIVPNRGLIYTKDQTPFVINQPVFTVYGQPHLASNVKEVSEYLSGLLEIEESSISAKLDDKKLKWVSLAESVPPNIKEQIAAKNFQGIGFSQNNIRYYPESSMAAHLLGFVGKNQSGDPEGYFGLEGYYNEQLRGRLGKIMEEKDALGNSILAGERQVIPEEDGRNLYLTLDKTVQFIAEAKLKQALIKYGAKSGTVTILNPHDGSIIAMASEPAYEPDRKFNYDLDSFKNPVINSSYEPGSTFKILIMAAGINENAVKPNDEYEESGPIEIGKYSIKTWNNKYHGKIRVPEILEYSSNVGMVYIADRLGEDKLISYLKKLGLGQLTGVDLQDEATPEMRHESKWYKIDFATASFGQGIAVTPLQMIRMASSIANGGRLVTPHIVEKISDNSGKIIKLTQSHDSQVFKKVTASTVTEMMVQAVEKGETKYLKPLGIKVAGKTGTAQIPISGHYDSEKTIASFVGFFPADNPKIIMLVTLREPTTSPWGSETAAPLFFNIPNQLISYYNIPLEF